MMLPIVRRLYMSKTLIVISLTVVIVSTNLAWAFWMFDTAITISYDRSTITQFDRLLDQVFVLLPRVALSGGSQAEISDAAKASEPDHQRIIKNEDGGYSVGWIVLWFDTQGRLVKVTTPLRGPDAGLKDH
jgi:hypothetical protein